jgi:hypothetical protein
MVELMVNSLQQADCFLLSVLSTESKKKKILSALCVSAVKSN